MIWHFSSVVALLAFILSVQGQSSVEPAVSVNGLSFAPSPTTTVTYTVTASDGSESITGMPFPYVSAFPVTVTRSGLVIITTATVTLGVYSAPSPPTASSSAVESVSTGSSINKGAIAGGVLGGCAIIIAAIAAFLWNRRRSQRHWRNWTRGRWNHLEGNGPPPYTPRPAQIHVGEAVHNPFEGYDVKKAVEFTDAPKQSVISPSIETAPPLLIRESHRSPAYDPFADPQVSPRSAHTQGCSSGPRRHHNTVHIELEEKAKGEVV